MSDPSARAALVTRTVGQPTLSSSVLDRLRADILRCELRPGAKLRFDALRLRYKINLGPLREALMRLAAEGLVLFEDRRGFRVAPVSRAELLDLTRVRQELEAMALRLAIERGDDRWEADVIAALHRLSRRACTGSRAHIALDDDWERLHRGFHAALAAGCGSPVLLRLREILYDQADRYRRLCVQYWSVPRRDFDEHRAIADAAIARDTAAACAALQRHIAVTTEIVLSADPAIFGEHPEP